MAEGVETPLLGQQLLVGHRVDGMREAKRGADASNRKVPIGAAGSRAGARVVDVRHQGVG